MLVVSGRRPVRETEGRAYQQVEIPTGGFRRAVELGVDVEAEPRPRHLRGRPAAGRAADPDAGPDRAPGADRARRRGRTRMRRVRSRGVRRRAPRSRSSPPTSSRRRSQGGGELPEALPVLPLRDMVTYPGTLTPLAVGQERSIRLIDEVLSGDRGLVMVASKDPELEEPGPDAARAGRRRRRRRADAQGPGRDDPDPRPGHPAGRARRLRRRPIPTSSPGSASCPTSSTTGPSCRR